MHRQIEESLSKMLDVAGKISCTCDTWTTENTVQYFLEIIAHWLTDDFARKSYVLQCMALDDRHTAQYFGSQFEVAISQWNIDKSRCKIMQQTWKNV